MYIHILFFFLLVFFCFGIIACIFSRVGQIQSFPSLKFLRTKTTRYEFRNSISLILNLSYISYRILEIFFLSYISSFLIDPTKVPTLLLFRNWLIEIITVTIPDPYFEAEVQVMVDSMTFSPSPSPHQELCLMYIFISKLCNCLRNAHNSVAACLMKKINK